MEMSRQAWVTLATNDSYALGALVLASSLKKSGTTRKIVVMVTPDGLSGQMRLQLSSAFDEVIDVSVLDSEDAANLALLERPELGITFTKLHCWQLVQYDKCVFLDADTMVLRNSDELFERSELSAAPDAGWPDCFNSGVFVFSPSTETYKKLIEFSGQHGSFDGGDQGLLNMFYANWSHQDIGKHLPFLYNMCATATYTYLPAFKHYGHSVKIIHFIGTSKPWHVKFDARGQPQPALYEEHTRQFLQQWWHIFRCDVQPKMTAAGKNEKRFQFNADVAEIVGNQPPILQEQPPSEPFPSVAEADRKRWEEGQPDFRGADSFDNIIKKIDSAISTPQSSSGRCSGTASPRFEENWPSAQLADLCERLTSLEDSAADVADVVADSGQEQWERGCPDFLGQHAFDNILVKLSETVDTVYGNGIGDGSTYMSRPNVGNGSHDDQETSTSDINGNATVNGGDGNRLDNGNVRSGGDGSTCGTKTVSNYEQAAHTNNDLDMAIPSEAVLKERHQNTEMVQNTEMKNDGGQPPAADPHSFDFVLQKIADSIGQPEIAEIAERPPAGAGKRQVKHCPTCGQCLPGSWKPIFQRRRKNFRSVDIL